ncbi:MAG: alginate export family protein [Methylococcaceae bacterium]
MRKKTLAGVAVNHVLNLIVVGGFCIGGSHIQAAEKKNYSKPPFTVFSSQMPDALLGSDKYEKPVWNLHDALKLPKWLSVSLEQRSRYETMDGTYKAGGKGGDQQIPLQTDFWLQANLGAFRLGTEFLDARALGADSGSGVNNTHADQADFLQGYAAWADQNVLYSGIGAEVIAGRQTLNFGSRRLIARNAMRNTINSFTGVRLRLTDYTNWQFNGFVTMPVLRYPTAATDIVNEEHEWDKEDTHTLFSGGFLELYNLGWGINSEMYLYHLDESDGARNQTRNRRYFTPGMRFFIKPAKAAFDFQLEAIGQLGTVRATTAAGDGKDLQHQAWYQHIDAGYTFAMPWTPRLALEYDYASGDSNPNDGKDQRFDTLYGARRFDYGPTGIYGAFARSNINSPGYRINVAPRSDVQATLSHRVFWLASATDAWTTSGLQDKTGRSGDFVGHQLDLSTRWDVNSSLNFETGWAHLFKGQFAKKAASAPNGQDIDYFYVQSLLRF